MKISTCFRTGRRRLHRQIGLGGLAILVGSAVGAQTPPLSVPSDSPRWDLQGQAKSAECLGRQCLVLDGGAAVLHDFEMRDGVIDADVATPVRYGFFGIQFRIANDGANAEWIYLRQHKSGLPDAMQYTPVLNTGLNWQIYNGPGFTGTVDIPKDPQPGMKVVYARTRIESDRDQVKKLFIGYSDDVSVFLNGRILFRGRSAQYFRDPNFLGIMNPENDAVYLPLKRGPNELMLVVSELGGGWGFICRLADLEH